MIFLSLFIFRGHSTREPVSSRVTYFILRAYTEISVSHIIIIIIIINPLTARVVGAPQMILQPVFSIFPCSPLTSGTCRTPGLSITWCCLPTSYFVRLVFFPLSLCLARWFWPDLMNGSHSKHRKKIGRSLGKNTGEWIGRVEISKEEIPGSKRSMYGYILTYSRL